MATLKAKIKGESISFSNDQREKLEQNFQKQYEGKKDKNLKECLILEWWILQQCKHPRMFPPIKESNIPNADNDTIQDIQFNMNKVENNILQYILGHL